MTFSTPGECVANCLLSDAVTDLRDLAVHALKRMYLPKMGLFAFRLRRGRRGTGTEDQLEGVSHRYTAIALLGLTAEGNEAVAQVLGKESLDSLCSRLIDHLTVTSDPGELGLTLWIARQIGHDRVPGILKRLQSLDLARQSIPTVELSWILSGLSISAVGPTDTALAERVAQRLLRTQQTDSRLFAHWSANSEVGRLRAHICCFADMVYPIQALAHHHRATGSQEAKHAALACGRRMCELQGSDGQWWWHFDIRTGRVVERYPVYAIHQDAMGPMALFDLQDSCGGDYRHAVNRSMHWLLNPPETGCSLVDHRAEVIWRKVCRREPGKLVRGLQAMVSFVHPAFRVPAVDALFPPVTVDHETRPYHMGWLLYAWRGNHVKRIA